ncbi:hypothetical protein [Agromyces sp. Marseille-P2726]|uniref:hypothetical protein n=1 Tax=Agromyces sp. Marseille-P2726 TaxID=2709132 RepID=UPI001571392A|nr:hypothetical protein [Agromyces sp. Marseille-P2726]
MKRISIVYAGREFSVGQEDFDRLKDVIRAAHEAGRTEWITVNHGEGRPQPAELLVGPGIPIALIPIDGSSPDRGGASGRGASPDAETGADTSVGGVDSLF